MKKRFFSSENPLYLKKVHLRLTFLFTAITGLVLILMSFLYLHSAESNLKNNGWLSFTSESNTILANFREQDTISYTWLADISSHSNYFLAVYDNGSPFLHNQSHLTAPEQAAAEEALSQAVSTLDSFSSSSSSAEFSLKASDGVLYYVNAAMLGTPSSPLYVLVLFSTETLMEQLFRQRLLFVFLNICGIVCLFLFSWYFTKKLLLPVQESQEKQNAFIAAASHELRTPLAVILSATESLTSGSVPGNSGIPDSSPSDPVLGNSGIPDSLPSGSASGHSDSLKAQELDYLSIIKTESHRMSTLVDDLLLLAKADHHSWQIRFDDVELDTLLLETYDAFYPLAKKASLSLSVDLPEEALPACRCDKERITQVLAVLVSNAISYGKRDGFIKLSLSVDSSYFTIKVTDNGIGISENAKPHIFDRFYREDPSRSKKGHFGLGLSIAKSIIDEHHGHILVTDTPGGGSTFTVKLPVF